MYSTNNLPKEIVVIKNEDGRHETNVEYSALARQPVLYQFGLSTVAVNFLDIRYAILFYAPSAGKRAPMQSRCVAEPAITR